MKYLDDLLVTFGLLILWLDEIIWEGYKPLDVFLFDRGYLYMGYGIWEKYKK